jgi:hypothetical protein
VHQLVDQDVIAYRRWHQHEPPVQGNSSVAAARSPACPLVAYAHAGHDETVLGSDLVQPGREFRTSTVAKGTAVVLTERRRYQPRALACDPIGVPLHEGVGFALGSAARNRHTDTAVVLDAEEIASRSPMAHEIDRLVARGLVSKRQVELHERQDSRTIRTIRTRRTTGTIYCVRSAVSGLTLLARRAGSHTAISETIVNTTGITMKTAGSRACTS